MYKANPECPECKAWLCSGTNASLQAQYRVRRRDTLTLCSVIRSPTCPHLVIQVEGQVVTKEEIEECLLSNHIVPQVSGTVQRKEGAAGIKSLFSSQHARTGQSQLCLRFKFITCAEQYIRACI